MVRFDCATASSTPPVMTYTFFNASASTIFIWRRASYKPSTRETASRARKPTLALGNTGGQRRRVRRGGSQKLTRLSGLWQRVAGRDAYARPRPSTTGVPVRAFLTQYAIGRRGPPSGGRPRATCLTNRRERPLLAGIWIAERVERALPMCTEPGMASIRPRGRERRRSARAALRQPVRSPKCVQK